MLESWQALTTPLIVALIPIIVMLLKRVLSPARFGWAYPLIATALGPAFEWFQSFLQGVNPNAPKGVLLGMAAVALREILDQLKKVGGAR